MWWVGNKSCDAFVGQRRVILWAGRDVLLDETIGADVSGFSLLGQALLQRSGITECRVWLGAGLCQPFLVPEFDGVRGSNELLEIAKGIAADQTMLIPPFDVWLDGGGLWPRLAAAINSSLLGEISRSAGTIKIKQIRPWWSEALRSHLNSFPLDECLAIADADGLTFLGSTGGRFIHAKSYFGPDPELSSLLNRALVAANWEGDDPPVVELGAVTDGVVKPLYRSPE